MSIEELEMLREKAKKSMLMGGLITVSIGAIVCLVLQSFFPFIFIGIIGLVITSIVSNKPARAFTAAFKETFVLASLKDIFTDLNYFPERGLAETAISSIGMMDMGDRYSSNDYFCGKYKNINVVQADVHIEEEHTTTDSDGNTDTTWVTLFRGRWMVFDFNKNFKANIQVRQKGFKNARVNNWGNALKYEKVLMEDQMFNKQFGVFAQSAHEAFYILTPALMEKIKTLASNVEGNMLLCFVNNKLHVGVHNNEDSFEHGIFTKINEEEVKHKIAKDIKLITNFVDELNLDNDLFRKEV